MAWAFSRAIVILGCFYSFEDFGADYVVEDGDEAYWGDITDVSFEHVLEDVVFEAVAVGELSIDD